MTAPARHSMMYRPKVDQSTFDAKTRRVDEWLRDGHTVTVRILSRGRETKHPELSKRIVDRIMDRVPPTVSVRLTFDGRSLTAELTPKADPDGRVGAFV